MQLLRSERQRWLSSHKFQSLTLVLSKLQISRLGNAKTRYFPTRVIWLAKSLIRKHTLRAAKMRRFTSNFRSLSHQHTVINEALLRCLSSHSKGLSLKLRLWSVSASLSPTLKSKKLLSTFNFATLSTTKAWSCTVQLCVTHWSPYVSLTYWKEMKPAKL